MRAGEQVGGTDNGRAKRRHTGLQEVILAAVSGDLQLGPNTEPRALLLGDLDGGRGNRSC